MLNTPVRLASAPLSLALLSAGTLLLFPSTAEAAPCVGGKKVKCTANGERTIPGRGGSGGGGDSTGGGPVEQPDIACPVEVDDFDCPTPEENAAPVPHIPTQVVVESATDDLALPSPTIHTAPSPKTYVRAFTSLWIDSGSFTPRTAQASVPDQVVTATATPQSVTWNMVERTITCGSAGSPNGTECGYTYNRSSASQPGGRYQITATINWTVAWTCQGACDPGQQAGTLPNMTTSSTTPLVVEEIQTSTRPR
ncbi:hypothetical protein Acsp04_01450 [Actinomadura sp. NBRC 104425]|uniref:hypothetical protein n=1 Tax=Actinomadura sp. NBRC 104425 TaxID=3032204 RepID=UPI0024A3B16B|nr:hypothetical protein [Actinomadura sp. NBRC 104425]GLZ09910.1 hypothetical protein Acsp04_01450 [Actinomadura sp. NBRC 104425]